MLNFIPALLLLLASSPFGSASVEALARVEGTLPISRSVNLAHELSLAGLTAAQAVLVIASCEKPTKHAFSHEGTQPSFYEASDRLLCGTWKAVRSRDGPVA